MQSTQSNKVDNGLCANDGLHVAVIMDGNGRWAAVRGMRREEGHRAGAAAVRRVVEAAPPLGIRTLSLYAFSSDNWKRPRPEVQALLRLFEHQLAAEADRCAAEGVRLSVIGRRDRLPRRLQQAICKAEALTAAGEALHLRLAVDYSAREAILRAAAWPGAAVDAPRFARALGAAYHTDESAPDVDLLIRTGGEQRLSDFLLWECAYAELYFTERMWPDFDADDLAAALRAFHARERRYGGLPAAADAA